MMGRIAQLAGAAFAIVALATAGSARAADFYAGKTLGILVNFTPGGPTDLEARLLSRHIAKHIAGNPQIVVRNMAGAGGVIGANWLGEVAPPDGLTVGYFTGVASKSAIGEASLRIDVSKYAFVAGGPGISVTYIRSDVPPGIKKPADIMKAKDFWAGGLAPESDKDIRLRMQLDMLGLKYHYISNYPGSAEARLALERNEIQIFPESMPTYRAAIEPNLVKPGAVTTLWYDPLDNGKTFETSPDAEGIPAKHFVDFLKEVGREPPKGDFWDAFRLINSVGTVFLRIIVMPPGTPKEASDAIRKAFDAVNNDPEFREDAMRTVKFVPSYLTDSGTEALFQEKLRQDPRLSNFIRRYVEEGRAKLGK
jgi:tripartite-type tricarboxylate transporter receptor subunit TctC